tara:strand:+ start:564 stop:752 length:189 start_codon:yes stop_codon:yes gene_type:complete
MHPKLEQFINEDLLDELHQLQDHDLCPADILDTVYFFIEDYVDDEVNRRLDEMDETIKEIKL